MNRMKIIILNLLIFALLSCSFQRSQVQLISSLPETGKLLKDSTLEFGSAKTTSEIFINPEIVYQNVEGVGAALTHASAYVLNQQTAQVRDSILRVLLTAEGIGINYTRLCIGASDFAPDLFSYSETEDQSLSNFDISRDQTDVIPVLKEMKAINPGLHVMASPWSAPGWMKTSGSMVGGSLKPEYYNLYADYLIKYIKAYQSEGIDIEAITVQNEPLYGTAAYSCMDMSAEEQKVFIRDHLGPKFREAKIDTKIILYDHNCDHPEYPISILNDSVARQYVAGSGFHLYGGEISALCTVKDAHPDKDLYFTEQSGGGWAPDFNENIRWYAGNLIAGAMNCYSKNVLLWNLVLDTNYGPKNFGCQNCYGVVEMDYNGKITHRGEYYALAHYGKFVQPNAQRIHIETSENIQCVAFKNPDQSIVLLAVFRDKEAKNIQISVADKQFSYFFAPGEIVTFKL